VITLLTAANVCPKALSRHKDCKQITEYGEENLLRCCRPDWVIDQTFDLFVELGANDNQCDFPVVYASGVNGIAGDAVEDMSETLEPLFEAVVREVRHGLHWGTWGCTSGGR